MKPKYGIIKKIKEPPRVPVRELLRVPHQGKSLTVSYPTFGPNYFCKNIEEMQKTYLHPLTKKKIYFREPTTAESISASAYGYRNMAKLKNFHKRRLQAGRIVRTSEGVFANPPKDRQGNPVIDEKILKQYLNKSEKINGIYIVPNGEFEELRDYGFAPYESFISEKSIPRGDGRQSGYDFAVNPKTNGLARVLEHTENKVALKLKSISSKENYSSGVDVWSFDYVSEPIARIFSLDDGRDFGRLSVDGYNCGNVGSGDAFGVCKKSK